MTTPPLPPLNKREASKQRTRAKVLAAAQELFVEPGYETTTIKMIAERAGCATGSVFTTFNSKEAILTAIVADNYEAAATAFREGAERCRGQGVGAELKAAMRAGFEMDYPRRALVVHQIAASWTWTQEFNKRTAPKIQGSFGVIADIIRAGKSRGEIREEVDPDLMADQVLGVYLRCFRHDRFAELGVDGMAKRAAAHVDIMLDGAAVVRPQKKAV
jgi:TetR/AcrR family transcriptional regulator, cholesterol catabolism regulator